MMENQVKKNVETEMEITTFFTDVRGLSLLQLSVRMAGQQLLQCRGSNWEGVSCSNSGTLFCSTPLKCTIK